MIPPPLLEAMALYLCRSIDRMDETHAQDVLAPGLISAAARAGWVLVPRADLIDAAEIIVTNRKMAGGYFSELAARLRQATGETP